MKGIIVTKRQEYEWSGLDLSYRRREIYRQAGRQNGEQTGELEDVYTYNQNGRRTDRQTNIDIELVVRSDRQKTAGQKSRETDRQKGMRVDRQAEEQSNSHMRHMDRQKKRKAENSQTDRQAGRQTERQLGTYVVDQ